MYTISTRFFVEDILLDRIIKVFGEDHIKYICVVNEFEDDKPLPRLHIQILLHRTINTAMSYLKEYLRMYHFCLIYNQLCSIIFFFGHFLFLLK